MQLNFSYSIDSEANRIGYTLDRYAWYKENKYRINVPEPLREKAERGEHVSDEEIRNALGQEFDILKYEEAEKKLREEFEKIKDSFIPQLTSLGGPVHDSYDVMLTKYGVGGSYGLSNRIQVNIDYGRELSWKTLAHEMVHLAIEPVIQQYGVGHWQKERLVDLIMSKFFPWEISIQKSERPELKLQAAFDQAFPNIKKVITLALVDAISTGQ